MLRVLGLSLVAVCAVAAPAGSKAQTGVVFAKGARFRRVGAVVSEDPPAAEDAVSDAKDLVSDAKDAATDAQDAAKDAAEEAASKAAEAAEEASQKVDDAKEVVEAAMKAGSDKAEEVGAAAQEQVAAANEAMEDATKAVNEAKKDAAAAGADVKAKIGEAVEKGKAKIEELRKAIAARLGGKSVSEVEIKINEDLDKLHHKYDWSKEYMVDLADNLKAEFGEFNTWEEETLEKAEAYLKEVEARGDASLTGLCRLAVVPTLALVGYLQM